MTTYAARVTTANAAWRLLQALIAHPEGGSSYQLMRWTGLEKGQLEKAKRRLRLIDQQGMFICKPKGAYTIYMLSDDAEESRLYVIWMNRRAYRYMQSALATTVQTAKTEARLGTMVWSDTYADQAGLIEAMVALKYRLRRQGIEAGFTPKEIESWFAEDDRWMLDERVPA